MSLSQANNMPLITSWFYIRNITTILQILINDKSEKSLYFGLLFNKKRTTADIQIVVQVPLQQQQQELQLKNCYC